MIYYKIDVLKELKNKNLTTYSLKKANILGGQTITKLKNNNTDITIKNINRLCELLDMQPGDIIGYKPDTPPNNCDGSTCSPDPQEHRAPPITCDRRHAAGV